MLPENVANKIAAGEVVERPASVVKELVENALDAGAARVIVRLVAAGRRTIEVVDNGHGMSEQDALLAVERHTTSKIRKADDLEAIGTLGFRGEALASIAAVSRFELVTRRAKDEHATRIRIDGGVLREVEQTAAPVGTRVTVNRLYFNTPVRAKFLKGITTELGHSTDAVQRHSLAAGGVGFQLFHNEKILLDVPEQASLRDRVALIWGLTFARDLIDIDAADDRVGLRVRGLIGTPAVTRSARSHQFFFMNARPVYNRLLQYGFEAGYQQLLTVGRHPVCVLLLEAPKRHVDINIHPSKREMRFRDERGARAAIRDIVRERLAQYREAERAKEWAPPSARQPEAPVQPAPRPGEEGLESETRPRPRIEPERPAAEEPAESAPEPAGNPLEAYEEPVQTSFEQPETGQGEGRVEPEPFYVSVGAFGEAPLQLFDTYLLIPEDERLLIIDQHALHERLMYDALKRELTDAQYDAQQLAAPLLLDVPPSHVRLLETNLNLFARLGIHIEPFGGTTFQVTAVCHLYEESKVADAVYGVLDTLAQGDLFDREDFMAHLLRLAVEACRGAVKAGDRLSAEERRGLLEGFRDLRPPYTCPHGRPIITELTQDQMEKSFRRKQ
jgi:DNA mismatch repair protein MutL